MPPTRLLPGFVFEDEDLNLTFRELIHKRRAERRAAKAAAQGQCHWCGRQTIPARHDGHQSPTTRTIDHLLSKLHPLRRVLGSDVVVACYGCNQLRSRVENKLAAGKNVSPEEWRSFIRRTAK